MSAATAKIFASIQSEQIVGMILYPYLQLGLHSVHFEFASARGITIQSREEKDSPFESYSIDAIEGHGDPAESALGGPVRYECRFSIERIEIFRRSEWVENEGPQFSTIGSNAVSIDTGPIGAAPAGSVSTTVICAVAFSGKRTKSHLVISLGDTPGLLELMRDDTSLVESYRNAASVVVID